MLQCCQAVSGHFLLPLNNHFVSGCWAENLHITNIHMNTSTSIRHTPHETRRTDLAGHRRWPKQHIKVSKAAGRLPSLKYQGVSHGFQGRRHYTYPCGHALKRPKCEPRPLIYNLPAPKYPWPQRTTFLLRNTTYNLPALARPQPALALQ